MKSSSVTTEDPEDQVDDDNDEDGDADYEDEEEEEEEEEGPLAELRRRAPDVTITLVKTGQQQENSRLNSKANHNKVIIFTLISGSLLSMQSLTISLNFFY